MFTDHLKLKTGLILLLAIACYAGCHRWSRRINDWPIVNAGSTTGALVCFGDSLVAGVGAETKESSYPARLSALLKRPVRALGVPGETTASGLKRLKHTPEINHCPVVVTLGGNDLLQRVAWTETSANLEAIFRELQRRGCLVAYTGIEALGVGFKDHKTLCRENGVLLIPDFLGGISNNPKLKSDLIHPNDAGYKQVAERVADVLRGFSDQF